MTIENLEKELQQNHLKSIYLLYGEELFLRENCLKKIKKIFGECVKGINYIILDSENIGQIISDIETPSFGYNKKLIFVKNSGILKKESKKKNAENEKIRELLKSYIQENMSIIKDSVILVFIEDEVDNKLELFKEIDKNGVVCKFDFQKPAQIEARLKEICASYKVKIRPATVQYLIESCGTNMQDLINEARKLIEFVGENGEIKNEDIDLLSIKKIESIIFDLTDSLGKKDISKAIMVLDNLIYAKEPLIKILVTLYNHFKKLYITKLCLRLKKDVALSLNLKTNQTFLVGKYKMQEKYFKENELRNILSELSELDYLFKIGKIDLYVGLQSILCKYCS